LKDKVAKLYQGTSCMTDKKEMKSSALLQMQSVSVSSVIGVMMSVLLAGTAKTASAATDINCIGTSLAAGPNLEPAYLEPNQWLCDPTNPKNRFGMNEIGMPTHFVNDELVWHVASRGTSLQLHTENTNLGLYGEGMARWTTSCNSNAMGGSVVLTEDGELKLLNGNDDLVWAISAVGEEHVGSCIVVDEDDFDDETEDDYAAILNERGSGERDNAHTRDRTKVYAVAKDYAAIRPGIPIDSINNKAPEDTADIDLGKMVEDQIATVDITQFVCVGDTLAAGDSLMPTEYICDPNDDGNRLGLSYFGMVTFYRNNVLVWWKDTTGKRLVFQEDGNLVLEANGLSVMPKWSTGCFDEEQIGSDSYVGGNVVQFAGGEVRILDNNAVLMWRLDAAADESSCYPYGKKQTMNRANPFLCIGKGLSADMALGLNEFICDPIDNGNRFGLSTNGFIELYRGDELVWQSEEFGKDLWFSYDDAELVLRSEKGYKWTNGCKSDASGKKVKYTPRGVKITDRSGDLVWALSHDGFASSCFPEGGGPEEEDDDEADNDTVEQLPDNCRGYSLKVGEILRPNEFLCDPNDPSVRWGLSFVGMPQLLRGDDLVWFVPARGDKLVYQADGHLVLYGEGVVKWSTQCYGKSRGRQVSFTSGGIDLLDQDWNSVWKLDSDGIASECYPGFGQEAGAQNGISGL